MDSSTTSHSGAIAVAGATAEAAEPLSRQRRAIALRPWFYGFAGYLLGMELLALWLLPGNNPLAGAAWADKAWALVMFVLYLSLACTFIPLPTGPIIIALAGPVVSLAPDSMLLTCLAVATAGAIGSTMANLNDYHIFAGLLRWKRLSAVREKRLYKSAEKWFARAPFALLLIFNLVPIPVDVVRLLAITSEYPRRWFALANFIGRFLRYGLLAGLTFVMDWNWGAMLVMLVVAAGLGIGRILLGRVRGAMGKYWGKPAAAGGV